MNKSPEIKKAFIVSAYACSPYLGSEFTIAWNYVKEISKKYKIYLLFGSNSQDLLNIDKRTHMDLPNVVFINVRLNKLGEFFHFISHKMGLYWFWPLALREWNKSAYLEALKILSDENNIVGAHQLGPIGFKNAGYLWKLGIPSYWGPIGGLLQIKNVPARAQGFGVYLFTRAWNIANILSSKSSYIRNAASNFTKLSFGTLECKERFFGEYKRSGPIISEVATLDEIYKIGVRDEENPQIIKIIWVGSLIWRKNIIQTIDALEKLIGSSLTIELNIYGDGPQRNILLKKIEAFRKSNITINFYGHTSRNIILSSYSYHHVIIFNSLSEANSVALFEALSCGVIPIVPKEHGFATSISEEYGFFYNFDDPYEVQLNQIARAIVILSNHGEFKTRSTLLKASLKSKSINELVQQHCRHFYDEID